MKKRKYLIFGLILCSNQLLAQQNPTNTSPGGAGPSGQNNQQYWSRAGNNSNGGFNNIFGTLWNSPIWLQTNGLNRVQFFSNQGLAPTWVDPLPFGGGMAINLDPSNPIRNPLSLLHIGEHLQGNLAIGGGPQGGYRSWMKVGTFYGQRSDQLYVGMKPETTTTGDRADAIINWGDNTNLSGNPTADGPDFLRVIFTAPRGVAGYNTYAAGNDGLEVMRFQHNGSVGIGNFYNDALFPYRNPSRRLEILSDKAAANANGTPILRMTHTQQNPANAANTGKFIDFEPRATGDLAIQAVDNTQTPTGTRNLKQRFVGINTSNPGNTVEINSQLNTPNTLNGSGSATATGWAGLRFSDLNSTSIPQPNPGAGLLSVNANGDVVYVTAPAAMPPANNGVSRNTFTSGPYQLGDLYLNPTTPPFFLTTTPLTANRQVRLDGNNLIFSGDGRVAIGLDWPNLPTQVLDVNGSARFRNVSNSGGQFLMLGQMSVANINDLTLSKLPFSGGGNTYLAGDGTWQTFPVSGLGGTCTAPASVGSLTANTRVNLNNNNLYFVNLAGTNSLTENKVAVGYSCNSALLARFNVYQRETAPIGTSTIASYTENRDQGTILNLEFTGVRGISQGNQSLIRITNTGGSFTGKNASVNFGVKGDASHGTFTGGTLSYGGSFSANDVSGAYGVRAISSNTTTNGVSYAIHATSIGGGINRAGYFDGLIETTANSVQTSDSIFKTNINKLNSSLKLIQLLKPVSYTMDVSNYPQMNFDNHLQFGYIAQDVANVFPNLVYDSYRPSSIDSLGNPIDSSVVYKSLNYTGFIPINTAAIIELNQKVDKTTLSDETIKTNVQDLTGSLDKVLDMRGVSYDWNHTVHPELNLDSVNHVGFIAQEIAQIDPRLTYLADDSLLHVEYDKVVPILAEAIQELNDSIGVRDSIISSLITENAAQQATIEDLNNRLTQLENCLSGILPYLCQLSQSAIQANTPAKQEEVRSNLNVTLSNRNTIILDQNVPNPFAEQTVINFSIPETVKKAQIHFYDGNGRFMNSVEVVERGLGSVTVFGSDLSSGVYTYSLVADGQVVATKKMMKQ